MRWVAVLALGVVAACAAELKPRTSEAFDRYVGEVEKKLEARKSFLWADESAERMQKIKQGVVVVEPAGTKPISPVPDGFVHDWVGAVFIPGVSLQQTLTLVRDYDHNKDHFKPEVIDSKLLSHEGNDYRIYLRLLKKKVVTVLLNTEHSVHYVPVDEKRWWSASRTTKIAEVENAGEPGEQEKPAGTGEGFLWRLNSYWRFQERDGGTWVECQAVSLTRDIPTGLNWLIQPIIRSLPKESLENTLRETRAALVQ